MEKSQEELDKAVEDDRVSAVEFEEKQRIVEERRRELARADEARNAGVESRGV